MTRAHIIGAGLAGLSAAVALAEAGFAVILSDSAAHAGGRCRSYHDPQLDLVIDNGNHLVLSGNMGVRGYLDRIGAGHRLTGPDEARFAFVDLGSGRRWRVRPNSGRVPWWIASPRRRVPGTSLRDYLPLARLLKASPQARVADVLPTSGTLWERLLEPLLVAALNTPAADASAALASAIVSETLARGGDACRPLIADPTLSAAFIDPAVAWLKQRDARFRLSYRLRSLVHVNNRVTALDFGSEQEPVAAGEPVVLATPAWTAAQLLPGLIVPDAHHAIVNAHFKVKPPMNTEPIIGVVGGVAEWIFAFPDRLSVTISAADRLCDEDRAELAARIWRDVADVHRLPAPMPPWQIVREKRATFAATPEQDRRRPPAATAWRNLLLAGDWTQTDLPATIEGAIRSGQTAARLAAAMRAGHVAG